MGFRRYWVESLKTAETLGIERFTEIELETVRLFVSLLCQSPERMKQFLDALEEEAKKKEK